MFNNKKNSEIIFNLKESNGSLPYCKHLHKRNFRLVILGAKQVNSISPFSQKIFAKMIMNPLTSQVQKWPFQGSLYVLPW